MKTVQLSQNQREAVADILVLAMCVDDHFSMVEEEAIQKEIVAMGWEPGQSPDEHLSHSFSRARTVVHSPDQRRSYLEQLSPRLGSKEVKDFVFEKTFCQLSAHRLTKDEGEFIAQLRLALQI